MSRLFLFYRSSIGKKVVMAVTGLVLFGFVVVHMAGNLKVYQGAEKINAYGEFLRAMGSPVFSHGQVLWIARIVLLASVALHIMAAVQLILMNRRARPVGYTHQDPIQATYASRTMIWSGPVIALFVIYHLLHFTAGTVHPSFRAGDIYHNVIAGFRVWYVSAFYIVAMVGLGFHLYHGVWSLFQTLGINDVRVDRFFRRLAAVATVAVVAGNISIPVTVLLGLIS
ncbi:MAG: succinate dehydrogenase cytochrome b subunit [Candidatus Latescibacteria bacterium]|nr:succinate dehydrogenase cytochrome b subunit [Candidatus Latescibacterota bacterium]